MAYRVFVSHSTNDREAVAAVWDRVLQAGVQPYVFEHDPRPGVMVVEKIQAEIRACDAVVLLLTRHSATSTYVQQEIGFALALGKPVLPLIERGLPDERLAMLKGVEWVEFDTASPPMALDAISLELSRLRALKHNREDILLALGMVAAMLLLMYLASQEGV